MRPGLKRCVSSNAVPGTWVCINKLNTHNRPRHKQHADEEVEARGAWGGSPGAHPPRAAHPEPRTPSRACGSCAARRPHPHLVCKGLGGGGQAGPRGRQRWEGASEDLLRCWTLRAGRRRPQGLWVSRLPTALQGTGGATRALPRERKQQVPGRQWRGAAPASMGGTVASPCVRPPTEEGWPELRAWQHSEACLAAGAGLRGRAGRGPAQHPCLASPLPKAGPARAAPVKAGSRALPRAGQVGSSSASCHREGAALAQRTSRLQ